MGWGEPRGPDEPEHDGIDPPASVLSGTVCRVCGCSDLDACTPPCSWFEPDLCSACAPAVDELPGVETTADNGERYIDAAGVVPELGHLPVMAVDCLPQPGYPVTVVMIAQGEDEQAALDAIMLGHGMWLDYMAKADQGQSQANDAARQLRLQPDSSLIVSPHYTMQVQIRRVRHDDVPTMAEWVRSQHVAAGGGGADDAARAERIAAAEAARDT